MRNPEKMMAILDAMRQAPNGETVIAPARFWLGKEQQKEQHHAALLVDAGLATWKGPGETILRITLDGHRVMEKLEQDARRRTKLCELLRGGRTVIEAIATVMKGIELAT